MDVSLYRVESYKEIMKALLILPEKRGYLSKAAKFLDCQKSYLSRVIKSEVQLSLDHAYMLSQYWEFTPKERDFFILLVNKERASQKQYREFIEIQIKSLRKDLESVSTIIKHNEVESFSPNDGIYFSSWHWMAIHFLTACPQFQTIPQISSKTGLSHQLVETTLMTLNSWGFVKKESNKWLFNKGDNQLFANSPFIIFNHSNWRNRAVLDAQVTNENSRNLHFTNSQCISKKDFYLVRDKIINLIAEIKSQFGPSESEDLVILNIDYFFI